MKNKQPLFFRLGWVHIYDVGVLINQKLLNLIGGVMLTWETFHSRGRQQSIFQVGLDYYLQ